MPTHTFARSYGLQLVVLAGIRHLGHHPDLEAALNQGNQAVDVLTRISSARATDYAHDLLRRLRPWKCEPAVSDLAYRIRTELTAA